MSRTIQIHTGNQNLITSAASSSYATTASYAANVPGGIVSSSSQINTGSFTGSFIGSHTGTFPYASLTGTPSGIVSSSGQVTYTGLSSVPVGILSSSTQINVLSGVSASFSSTASYVNTLLQTVSASGNIAAGTNLVSNYSSGDEGGEILLAKPQTNSTIAGTGVTIDVYQNKLRIFEQGGTARGGYYDITALAAGVGTNLATGGTVTSVVAGNGLTGGTITSTGTITIDTGSAHFITGSTKVLDLKGVISSSTQQVVSTYTNATDNRVLTSTGTGGINAESTLTYDGTVLAISTNGAKFFQGGDDAALYDVNVANTLGIHGQQDSTVGAIKLGSAGQTIYSNATGVGIGTTSPGTTLHVQGNVSASSFTGSFSGSHTGTFPYASLTGVPSGIVSASGQVSYTGLSNIPTGILSSSTQFNALSGTSASFATTASAATSITFTPATSSFATTASAATTITFVSFSAGNYLFPQNLTVGGTLTAKEFYTQLVSSSIIYQSGSTKFGDTSDDVMSVTGSIMVQGSISASSFTGSVAGVAATASGLSGGTANYIPLWTSATAQSLSTIYQSSGNVGIGTISPVVALHVEKSNSGIIVNAGGSAVTGSGIKFRNDGYQHWTVGSYGSSLRISSTGDNGNTIWGNTPVDRLTILTGGNVGIGTTAPGATLHVQGNVSASSYTSSLNNNAVGFFGTASWAQSSSVAISSSFAVTSSYIIPSGLPTGTVSSSVQINTGSFTGSFVGDASRLINIPVVNTAIDNYVFVGNGVTTSYLLSQSYYYTSLFISVDGLTQTYGTDFSLSGATLQFVSTPPSESNIFVRGIINIISGSAATSYSGSLAGTASFALTASAATSITFTPVTSSFASTSSYVWPSGLPANVVSSSAQTVANISGQTISPAGVSSSNHIIPSADNSYNLGSLNNRWANIYTGDLNLSNEGSSGNIVDGTTGNWTIQEGENNLYIINNKSGKKFKIMLTEIE